MNVIHPEVDGSVNPDQPQATSIAELFNFFGSTTQTSSSDSEVQKVAQVFREYIEENKLENFVLVPISNQQTGNYGAVALCSKRVTEQGGVRYVCHIAMIEKSKQVEQQAAIINYGALPVEVFVSVADAYTPGYVAKVTAALERHFGKDALIAAGGWSVVYRDTNLAKDDFRPFIIETILAIDHAVNTTKRDRPVFNLKMLKGVNPVRVRSHIALDQYKLAPSGLPVRCDIKSELLFTQSGGQQKAVEETAELRVCETCAYVDLIYVPPSQGFFGGMQQPMMGAAPVPYYIPRINITNFAIDLPQSSLEFMLFGIASIASLAKNRSYGIVWRDNFGSTSNAKRNLGAVGLQVPGLTIDNQPGILDVASDARTLYTLMQTVMAENPVFTLELTQGGQANWATTIIAKIATGDTRSQELLIKAADNLTVNKFSEIYRQLCTATGGTMQQIVTTSNEPSLVGTYKHEGETRDIRELDLLAVLNMIGQKDPDMVAAYLATFASHDPIQLRLDRRSRILKSIAKDVQVRAYSRKYDFGGLFIQALTMAIAANGIAISNDNFMSSQDNVYTQTVGQWQNQMVNAQALNGLYQQQPVVMPGQNQWSVGGIYGSVF